jgi:hypothetical protein
MSENGNASLDEEREITPQIEDEIRALLAGDLQETALQFAAYLRENQMAPRRWFGPRYWRIPYEEYYLCSIFMDKDRWRVFFFSGDYSGEFDEGFKKAVQESVMLCISCTGDDCPKGKEMTVFGRKFADACFQFPVQFVNPNGFTLKWIMELLEYWKGAAPQSDSWHCR